MPITVVESIVRNLVRIVDFMPVYYGVGVLCMLFNAQARRLGDLAAGTVVVKERKEVTLAALGRTNAPLQVHEPLAIAALGDPALWPLERLTVDDMYVLKEFLARRGHLINRPQLALWLAQRFSEQLDLALPDSPQAPEAFLEQVAVIRET
jgi:hypothetical protein